MKKVVCLVGAALVALLILAPTALAQDEDTMMPERNVITIESKEALPKSGGLSAQSVLVPAAALLLGSGVLAFAVLRGKR